MQRTSATTSHLRLSARFLPATLLLALTASCTDKDPLPPAPVASVRVAPNVVALQIAEGRQLSATLHTASGAQVTGPQITWSSSDTLVATVSATGTVTARAVGSAIVTARSEGRSGEAAITVTGAVASVQVAPEAVSLQASGTEQLSATPRSSSGAPLTDLPVAWVSSDTLVATVSTTGVVTARGAGSAIISASSGGVSGQATVTVFAGPTLVESVELDINTAEIEEGEVLQITATPRSAQGTPIHGLGIQWRTSDETIAQVTWGGRVTAIRSGTATLTARVHGKEASVTVTVTASYPYDLLYAAQTEVAQVTEPYRLDIRDAAGQPVRLPFAGATTVGVVRASPDGRRLALVAQVDGRRGIFVANRDGTGLRALVTDLNGSIAQPTWSPDGSRIAYSVNPVGVPSSIWVVNVEGDPSPVNLTADLGEADQFSPSWSPQLPDGSSRIAFTHYTDVHPRIWTMRPDGSDKRQLTTGGGGAHDLQPAWSPDGQTIAFQRWGYGAIWLVNATGGNERMVVSRGMTAALTPAWSPDGKLIAFSARQDGVNQIFTVWADGSKLAQRTFGGTNKYLPAWLPRP